MGNRPPFSTLVSPERHVGLAIEPVVVTATTSASIRAPSNSLDFWAVCNELARQQLGTLKGIVEQMRGFDPVSVVYAVYDLGVVAHDSNIAVLPQEILYVESVAKAFATTHDLWRRHSWTMGPRCLVCYTGPDGNSVVKRFLGILET